MLEASDEIDLKPSSRACSRGPDFISMSNTFPVLIFFEHVFFSNSLNKKRMNGRSKYVEKKIGHHACIRVNDFNLFSLVSLASYLLLPGQQIVHSEDVQCNTGQ